MPQDKDRPDQVNEPLRLAEAMFQAQIDAFVEQMGQPDAIRQWFRDQHIRAKDLRGN